MYIKSGAKEFINGSFKCNKRVADHLIYQCSLPLLSRDANGKYCFAKTKELEEVIANLPFFLKVLLAIDEKKGGKI